MKLITANLLSHLNDTQKRRMESILPELVKRLIESTVDIDYLRMPSGDDINSPGFDGIVECKKSSKFIKKGLSVWEFGTNAKTIEKIESDYKKRTNNSLGIDKLKVSFYFVIPKTWRYKTSITEWEKNHSGEWKSVKIIDGSILCDWINSVPSVIAWFLEEIYEEASIDFCSIEKAWDSFSQKTSPRFSKEFFCIDRSDEILKLKKALKEESVIRIKSDFRIDAYGFCLTSLLGQKNIVVVNNEKTYRLLVTISKNTIYVLSFPFDGDTIEGSKIIVCLNKESLIKDPTVLLLPYRKSQFVDGLISMGLRNYEAEKLYQNTHGNLFALLRIIHGTYNDFTPKWAYKDDADLLYGILFLRYYNLRDEYDKDLISHLADCDYSKVEKYYSNLTRLEDYPIKRIPSRFEIVNYEEMWLALHPSIDEEPFIRLHNSIISTLNTICNNKVLEKWMIGIKNSFDRLCYNYIFFSTDNPESDVINEAIEQLIKYVYQPSTRKLIIKCLVYFAASAPHSVMDFLLKDYKKDNGIIMESIAGDHSVLSNIVTVLEELTYHSSTKINACNLLFDLCKQNNLKDHSDFIKESISNILTLWNTHSGLSIEERKSLCIKYSQEDPELGFSIIGELLTKGSIISGTRQGAKATQPQETTIQQFLDSHNELAKLALAFSIENKNIKLFEKVIGTYNRLFPDTISSLLPILNSIPFSSYELLEINMKFRRILVTISLSSTSKNRATKLIEVIQQMIEATRSQDAVGEFGWLFGNYYSYDVPDERFVYSDDRSFKTIETELESFRTVSLQECYNKYGLEGVDSIVQIMSDEIGWGKIIVNTIHPNNYLEIISHCIVNKKELIVVGIIDNIELPYVLSIVNQLDKSIQKKVLCCLSRKDIISRLNSEEQKKWYWSKKRMIIYDEEEYCYLMRYNPLGLLLYFSHLCVNSDFDNEKAKKIYEYLIELFGLEKEVLNNYSFEICRLISSVDKYYYSDEWAEACISVHSIFQYLDIPLCVRKYYLFHPEKIADLLNEDSDYDYYYFLLLHYCLPDLNTVSEKQFFYFADVLLDKKNPKHDNLLSFLGNILGREKCEKESLIPHRYIRNLLEKYQDEQLNNQYYYGLINEIGVRCVTD